MTTNRGEYNLLCYADNLTDAERVLVEPLIPPAKRGGRKSEVDLDDVIDDLFYVRRTGCHWRAIPKDLSLKHAVRRFRPVELTGHSRLHSCGSVREIPRGDGRGGRPTAAIIDSQSVKGKEKVLCIDPCG